VRIVGIDLAWGRRAATGLCAVEGARVLDSASVRTDAEIEAWVRRSWAEGLLLAIDAPLIVRNRRGHRPCDVALAGAFRAQRVALYPANLGRPAFRNGGRAAALARRLGASVDPLGPWRPGACRAIDVYPHAALVALFDLSETLKYKARAGRRLEGRRAAFATLLDCLRALAAFDPPLDVTTGPRWAALEGGVAAAASGAALDRLEDELDAHVCAYVGLYHLAWRGSRSVVVGDAARGYVVTPGGPDRAEHVRAWAARRGVPVH
jgi:predicted RNase H-like nuclease